MTNTDLKELLDALHDKYNSPDFIADDRDFSPRPSPGATVRPLSAVATA